MFGYVGPLTCELRIKDKTLYDAYYCGLCREIGKSFGQPPRATLSYDCTFLALLIASVKGPVVPEMHRCGFKPLSKRRAMIPSSEAVKFSANVNIILTWYKLRDDWSDERKASALALRPLLSSSAKKAFKACPEVAGAVERGLAELSGLERANCADIDAPCDAFARMMREIMLNAPVMDKRALDVMAHMSYHMGRWIYLADAWDDRAKDEKSGAYNPFTASGAKRDRAGFLMNISLTEAVKAYDLLNVIANKGILDNIIRLGCYERTCRLLYPVCGGTGAIDESAS